MEPILRCLKALAHWLVGLVPVSRDEYVLRAIPNVKDYYNSSLGEPIQRVVFQPDKRRDLDGLSVFRERFVTATKIAMALPKRGDYYVVRLSVEDLNAIGLTVIPKPVLGQPPGHALIPELSYEAYRADKPRSKDVQRALVRISSDPGALVFRPPKG